MTNYKLTKNFMEIENKTVIVFDPPAVKKFTSQYFKGNYTNAEANQMIAISFKQSENIIKKFFCIETYVVQS